jgi:hypothetical protein
MLEIVNTQNVSLYHIFAAHFMVGYALETCVFFKRSYQRYWFLLSEDLGCEKDKFIKF